MKYSEIHKRLKKAGCHIVRNGKKHPIWKSPITGELFETSYHESEEAKPGTLRDIAIRSGVKDL
ncbi:MAG: type II toxin-antitoxin system HicA family toxin [Bacteroidales bacterium]|nr:type II toxin-antitoxin system HicA family toxin [Bacteroidales bacterium]